MERNKFHGEKLRFQQLLTGIPEDRVEFRNLEEFDGVVMIVKPQQRSPEEEENEITPYYIKTRLKAGNINTPFMVLFTTETEKEFMENLVRAEKESGKLKVATLKTNSVIVGGRSAKIDFVTPTFDEVHALGQAEIEIGSTTNLTAEGEAKVRFISANQVTLTGQSRAIGSSARDSLTIKGQAKANIRSVEASILLSGDARLFTGSGPHYGRYVKLFDTSRAVILKNLRRADDMKSQNSILITEPSKYTTPDDDDYVLDKDWEEIDYLNFPEMNIDSLTPSSVDGKNGFIVAHKNKNLIFVAAHQNEDEDSIVFAVFEIEEDGDMVMADILTKDELRDQEKLMALFN